jgi:hypothetical protein
MDDIRINVDFVDHPKTRRLIRQAGHEAFYCLIRLFSTSAKIYQKGVLKNLSAVDVEDICGWHGKSGKFFTALTDPDMGFLEQVDGQWQIHDWKEHQPWIYAAEERSEIAKKNISKRWNKDESPKEKPYQSNTNGNTDSIPTVIPNRYQSDTPSPIPIPKKENITPVENTLHAPLQEKSPPGITGIKRFSKPTVEQIEAYCAPRHNGISAQDFYDFYESKGWMVGSSPMKDWRAAVRTWENSRVKKTQEAQAAGRTNDKFAGEVTGDITERVFGKGGKS